MLMVSSVSYSIYSSTYSYRFFPRTYQSLRRRKNITWKIVAVGTGLAAIAMASGAFSGFVGNITQNAGLTSWGTGLVVLAVILWAGGKALQR